MIKRHAVYKKSGRFQCSACSFSTDSLTNVAQHVVTNQYEYRPPAKR